MKKTIKSKIRSISGESIGETLVALLISALALLMLAGAIGSASKIVTRNKTAMDEYYVGAGESKSQQAATFDKWKTEATTNLP
ncbi:MAG: hypothetical protein IJI71_02600 [Clostridia bacterium]|nr:hypothetical protein [Clostridia bacterium]